MDYRIFYQRPTWEHSGYCPGCDQPALIHWNIDVGLRDDIKTSGRHRGAGVCQHCHQRANVDDLAAAELAKKVWTHQGRMAA